MQAPWDEKLQLVEYGGSIVHSSNLNCHRGQIVANGYDHIFGTVQQPCSSKTEEEDSGEYQMIGLWICFVRAPPSYRSPSGPIFGNLHHRLPMMPLPSVDHGVTHNALTQNVNWEHPKVTKTCVILWRHPKVNSFGHCSGFVVHIAKVRPRNLAPPLQHAFHLDHGCLQTQHKDCTRQQRRQLMRQLVKRLF